MNILKKYWKLFLYLWIEITGLLFCIFAQLTIHEVYIIGDKTIDTVDKIVSIGDDSTIWLLVLGGIIWVIGQVFGLVSLILWDKKQTSFSLVKVPFTSSRIRWRSLITGIITIISSIMICFLIPHSSNVKNESYSIPIDRICAWVWPLLFASIVISATIYGIFLIALQEKKKIEEKWIN